MLAKKHGKKHGKEKVQSMRNIIQRRKAQEKEGGKEVYSDFTDLAEKLKKLKK